MNNKRQEVEFQYTQLQPLYKSYVSVVPTMCTLPGFLTNTEQVLLKMLRYSKHVKPRIQDFDIWTESRHLC